MAAGRVGVRGGHPLTVSWELSQARRAKGHTDVLCEPIVGQGGKHKREFRSSLGFGRGRENRFEKTHPPNHGP